MESPKPVTVVKLGKLGIHSGEFTEKIVIPISEKRIITDTKSQLFPKEKLESISSEIATGLPGRRELIPIENLPIEIVTQDVEERALDRTILAVQAQAKKEMLKTMAEIIGVESSKTDGSIRMDINKAVLEYITDQINVTSSTLDLLSQNVIDGIVVDPFDDSKSLKNQKQQLVVLTHQVSSLLTSTDRVSPRMGAGGKSQKGPLQAHIAEFDTGGRSVYVREDLGSTGKLLEHNLRREFRVPKNTASSRGNVEVFSSGMSALNTTLEGAQSIRADIIITEGTYFEIAQKAQRSGVIIEQQAIDDQFYLKIAREIKRDSDKPLVIFSQPFGSGIEDKALDLNRLLDVIENSDGNREVVLVLDTTMHGTTLDKFDKVEKINSKGIRFTLVEAQSLVKNGQLGMDTVTGGAAISYGSRPEISSLESAALGSKIREHDAGVLFPIIGEAQTIRIMRSSRNAEFLAASLHQSLINNPIINNVHYLPEKDVAVSNQYTSKPPFLFIELSPLVNPRKTQMLVIDLTSVGTIIDHGTSYGFDNTRVEEMPIGKNGSEVIRVAAGQESTLQIIAVAKYIEKTINSPDFQKEVSAGLREEIEDIINPTDYERGDVRSGLYFLPKSNDQGIEKGNEGRFAGIKNYICDQSRGHAIINEINKKPEIAKVMGIESEKIKKLNDSLDSIQDLKQLATEYAILQSVFIEKFRQKLQIFGKKPSPERAYLIAKMVCSNKAVRITMGPIAKVANKLLREIQPTIEANVGTKLPFDF